jgi:hypothetical protein
MALSKGNVPINFAQGLDTKTDPKQVQLGKFLRLQNTVFNKAGRLTKRNGYGSLTALPDSDSTNLTTFNGNLTAISDVLTAYAQGSNTWVEKGSIEPVDISTLPLIRSNLNQSQVDCAIASNGLICTVYTDSTGAAASYKYVIADSVTGQNIVAPTLIAGSSGTTTGSPRVFLLGAYFIIVFTTVIMATSHLQYIAVSTSNPSNVTAAAELTSSYVSATTLSWDAVVSGTKLYFAYNTTTGGQSIKVSSLSTTFSVATAVTYATEIATIMSLTADESIAGSPIIYVSYYDLASTSGKTLAVDRDLNSVLAPTSTITATTVKNLTSTAINGVCRLFYEVSNSYSYSSSITGDSSNITNFIRMNTLTVAGVLGTPSVLKRSVGLASKAFLINSTAYMLAIYVSAYQPTYFLLKQDGSIVAKLAYSNGGGYYTTGLPSATVSDSTVQVTYLIKDLVAAANKEQGSTNPAGVYSQTGINLATLDIGSSTLVTAEIGNDLLLTGGFLWSYDGYTPVENGFHLWPDHVGVTTSGAGGFITAQQYYYQATYEWSDNQGNVFRSAPSVPVTITTTGATSSNTLKVPTLRLTAKTANPVKIVIYRWSTAQQTYYQVTSISSPTLNDPTVDSITYVDTLADSSIIGNNILYTTGGVLENIGGSAMDSVTLYKSRLVGIMSEDKNLLGYSKQVIETTPVEMSDLLTTYVAPTTAAQGNTGPMRCLSALDDKLVIFKDNAIYYITGTGPDNTGANNDFSEPTFITATVGCDNQQSIVFMPSGLMFQSDKGIWLLDRSLSTSYIGAPVESFTQAGTVQSAVNVPGTNQVRFTLDSGVTLMYDYYYGQWGVFTNVPAISSTLYQGKHTYLNSRGQVFQETPGLYIDGSSPVLIGFTTSWLNLAGVQGFERAYEFFLLGTYITPHKLTISIAYDYNSSPTQITQITPDNYSGTYGSGGGVYGTTSPYGGVADLEQWRIFLSQQKCQAFQISIDETFDPSIGAAAGAGLTLSGLDITVGVKGGTPKIRASRQAG